MNPVARGAVNGPEAARPVSSGARWTRRRSDAAAVLLAACAGLWHALLLTRATNDNFLHMTFAQQVRAGDWPVRDFFDHGWVLQYLLSAAAQAIAGERLAAEALIVGAAWAISTWAVFRVVHRLTGSPLAAAFAAVMLIVSGARGYSYPKGIVYAGVAALWWSYARRPTTRKAVLSGAWAAVAFYWRPDHGLYVAAGVALGVLATHGLRLGAVTRTAAAAATMTTLVLPFLVYVQVVYGLPDYIRAGIVQAEYEHSTHGAHRWPIVQSPGRVVETAPAGEFAPLVGIRWSRESPETARRDVLARYGLQAAGFDDGVQRVRLSEESIAGLRALINEPIVEDTAGIDRSTATIADANWPAWDRWAFEHPIMRLRVLPSLDDQARSSEIAAAFFYLLPLLTIALAPWLAPRLAGGVTAGRLAAFAAFAILIDIAMIREPIPARVPDAVVLPAALLGILFGGIRNGARLRHPTASLLAAVSSSALVVAAVAPTAAAGQFGERLDVLMGRWVSLQRAAGAWSEAGAELSASPPLRHYIDRPARFELRLAAYVRACVPVSDRVLVLWFEPDVYYYSGRLMAQRHLVFVPPWADVPREQDAALTKVRRWAPPLVLARRSSFEGNARAAYPAVVAYVEENYEVASVVEDGGEQYVIYSRRDRAPLRGFGPQRWPCFVSEPSVWERVGSG